MRRKRSNYGQSIFVGDKFETTRSGTAEVVEYNSSTNCIVRFSDGTLVKCQANNLQSGRVRNPNAPVVCGIGYMGVGTADSSRKAYGVWGNMIRRCYGHSRQLKNKSYEGCTVHESWHNYQNFVKWYDSQYSEDGWHIDKDLLIKGNKVYSPETCRLVPWDINSLTILRKSDRGEQPLGVCYYKGHYYSQISTDGKQVQLAKFPTSYEAFQHYAEAKSAEANRLAEKFKGVICPDVYKALVNFVVDITD